MSLITALGFLVSGLALLLFEVETRRGFCPAQAFILGTGWLALLGLISYGYRALSLYRARLGHADGIGNRIGVRAVVSRGIGSAPGPRSHAGDYQSNSRRRHGPALFANGPAGPAMLGALRLLGEKAGILKRNRVCRSLR